MADYSKGLKDRIGRLSDEELIKMIEGSSKDYTEEALSIAKVIAENRGGIEVIKTKYEEKKRSEFEKQKQFDEKLRLEKTKIKKKEEELQPMKLPKHNYFNDETRLDAPTVYGSTYDTTRIVAKIISFIGWIVIIISVIIFAVFAINIVSTKGSGHEFDWLRLLLRLIPAIGGVISGLLLVIIGQLTRAIVDNTDYTGEMLALMKRKRDL